MAVRRRGRPTGAGSRSSRARRWARDLPDPPRRHGPARDRQPPPRARRRPARLVADSRTLVYTRQSKNGQALWSIGVGRHACARARHRPTRPDSRRSPPTAASIAFIGFDGKGRMGIWVAAADGSGAHALHAVPGREDAVPLPGLLARRALARVRAAGRLDADRRDPRRRRWPAHRLAEDALHRRCRLGAGLTIVVTACARRPPGRPRRACAASGSRARRGHARGRARDRGRRR